MGLRVHREGLNAQLADSRLIKNSDIPRFQLPFYQTMDLSFSGHLLATGHRKYLNPSVFSSKIVIFLPLIRIYR